MTMSQAGNIITLVCICAVLPAVWVVARIGQILQEIGRQEVLAAARSNAAEEKKAA